MLAALTVIGLGAVLLWLRWLTIRERPSRPGARRHGDNVENLLSSHQLAITARRPAFWIGLLFGLAVWITTMARYPRVSDGPHESNGSGALFPLLLLAAFVLGAVEPRRPKWMAASLIIAPLLLAPWTTPRGDGDGLWGLIFPMLVALGVVMVACAQLGGWLRKVLWRERGD